MRLRYILIFILLFSFLFFQGCGYFELSTQEEITLGEQVAMEVESYYDLYRDKEITDRVDRIGSNMALFTTRPFIYRFKVLDCDDINAFAIPGGHIYIYRGLLDMGFNDDQVAAIIAHEITHIEANHFAQLFERMKRKEIFYTIAVLATGGAAYRPIQILSYLDAYLFEPKFSRENETECDMSAVQMLIKAGRNPQEFAELFKIWEKEKLDSSWVPGWMKSHPDFITRIRNIEEEISLQSGILGNNISKTDIYKSDLLKKNTEQTADIAQEENLEDYFDIKLKENTLNLSWNNDKKNIKELECYGLSEEQKAICSDKVEDGNLTLENGKNVKYVIISVRYNNGDFWWDVLKV